MDPICTLIFAVIVLFTTIGVLKDTLKILLEGTPRGIKYDSVLDEILKVRYPSLYINNRMFVCLYIKISMLAWQTLHGRFFLVPGRFFFIEKSPLAKIPILPPSPLKKVVNFLSIFKSMAVINIPHLPSFKVAGP